MENIYHRYLDFPFEIQKHHLVDTIPDNVQHIVINPYRDKSLDALHDHLGIYTQHAELFYTPPNGGEVPIHTDNKQVDSRAKIIVTWGPEEGIVKWWTSTEGVLTYDDDEAKKQFDKYQADENWSNVPTEKHTLALGREEDCTLVYTANTNKVSLINVGELHSTYNPHPTEGRWTLCFIPASNKIRNGEYLTFQEALEIYKDYII